MENEERDVKTLTLVTFVTSCLTSTVGFIFTTAYLTFNVYHRNKRFMKMSSPKLNVIISSGGMLLNLTCLLYGIEFFFHGLYPQSSVLCQMRLWMVILGLTLQFSPMFVKSWRVYQIFKNAGIKRVIIKDKKLMLVIAVFVLLDVFLLAVWQGVDPPISTPSRVLLQGRIGLNQTEILVQECTTLNNEVWVPLILLQKSTMMVGGLYLAWKTKHVTLPAMRDSACILISVLSTVFLGSFGFLLATGLRHNPDCVATIYIIVVTGFSTIVQNAVFFPKVKFYWKSTLEQQLKLSITAHELQPQLTSMSQYEEELVHLVAENNRLKKSLTQKNSTIQLLEMLLDKTKRTLRRVVSEGEGRLDSGLDTTSSTCTFAEDDGHYVLAGNVRFQGNLQVRNLNNQFHMAESTCTDLEMDASRGLAEGQEGVLNVTQQSLSTEATHETGSSTTDESGENSRDPDIDSSSSSLNIDTTSEEPRRDSLTTKEILQAPCRSRHSYSERLMTERTPVVGQHLLVNQLRYSLRRPGREGFRAREFINSRKYNAQRLMHWKEEIDADLTQAHILSTSLKESFSHDVEKLADDNTWVVDSIKSRQDIVGSLAQCYNIEDNTDTLEFVSNFVPYKLPKRTIDFLSISGISLNSKDENTPTPGEKMKNGQNESESRQTPSVVHKNLVNIKNGNGTHGSSNESSDGSDVGTYKPESQDCHRLTMRKASFRTPTKNLFTKYLVSDVTNAQKNYYL